MNEITKEDLASISGGVDVNISINVDGTKMLDDFWEGFKKGFVWAVSLF